MATVGSGEYAGDLRSLETIHANISARGALGLGVTARLEALFSSAGPLFARNLVLRVCASLLDRSLRADNSTLCMRMHRWTRRVYDIDSRTPFPTGLALPSLDCRRIGDGNEGGKIITETWVYNLLDKSPWLPDRYHVRSAFFANAPEINSQLLLEGETYNFPSCDNWYTVGLQILAAVGWPPDNVLAEELNVARPLLPRCLSNDAWTAAGSAEAMVWDHDSPVPKNLPQPDRIPRPSWMLK